MRKHNSIYQNYTLFFFFYLFFFFTLGAAKIVLDLNLSERFVERTQAGAKSKGRFSLIENGNKQMNKKIIHVHQYSNNSAKDVLTFKVICIYIEKTHLYNRLVYNSEDG